MDEAAKALADAGFEDVDTERMTHRAVWRKPNTMVTFDEGWQLRVGGCVVAEVEQRDNEPDADLWARFLGRRCSARQTVAQFCGIA